MSWPIHPSEANVDGLTRMASHRAFQDRLEHECDRAYRFGDSFALLILDLDQFHLVNERHRHKTGDHVLTGLAGRLGGMIREIDLCARFGGDQFAIILPHTYQKGGVDAAERLRQSVAAWSFHTPENTELRLTASAGLAFYPGDGTKPAELVQAARDALAFAKSLGGNQIQLYPELSSSGENSDNVVKLTGSGYGTIVRSLAAAVDVRDRYTHSHSRSSQNWPRQRRDAWDFAGTRWRASRRARCFTTWARSGCPMRCSPSRAA